MKLNTKGDIKLQTFRKSLDTRTFRLNTAGKELDRKNPEIYMDGMARRYWRQLSMTEKEKILVQAGKKEELQNPRESPGGEVTRHWNEQAFRKTETIQKKTVQDNRLEEQKRRLWKGEGLSAETVTMGQAWEPVSQKFQKEFQADRKEAEKAVQKNFRRNIAEESVTGNTGKQDKGKDSFIGNQSSRRGSNSFQMQEQISNHKELQEKIMDADRKEEKQGGYDRSKSEEYREFTGSSQTKTSRSSHGETKKAYSVQKEAVISKTAQETASLGNAASPAVKTAKAAANLVKHTAREAMLREEEKRSFAVSSMVTAEGFAMNSAQVMGAPSLEKAVRVLIAVVSAFFHTAFLMFLPLLTFLALLASLVAGILSLIFGGASSGYVKANVSEVCERYRPVVEEYAVRYNMMEYVELILAVMMQESGGTLPDVMQAAEGAYNTRYPHVPNGITDPEYSIECGIQELKHALELAECTGPTDMEHIRLALQGYNFGPGYITWALRNYGGYSEDNAAEFSDMMAAKMGWSAYGDKKYPEHVLRYYQVSYGGGDADAIIREGMKCMGMPYVYGGSSMETSFDCSGFVYYVFNKCGYQVPRYTAQGFYNVSIKIPSQDAAPGDLVFFERTYQCGERITHIGIYIGNGQMMHFGNPGKISAVSIFGDKFVGYGRLQLPG